MCLQWWFSARRRGHNFDFAPNSRFNSITGLFSPLGGVMLLLAKGGLEVLGSRLHPLSHSDLMLLVPS